MAITKQDIDLAVSEWYLKYPYVIDTEQYLDLLKKLYSLTNKSAFNHIEGISYPKDTNVDKEIKSPEGEE